MVVSLETGVWDFEEDHELCIVPSSGGKENDFVSSGSFDLCVGRDSETAAWTRSVGMDVKRNAIRVIHAITLIGCLCLWIIIDCCL